LLTSHWCPVHKACRLC